MSEETTQEVAVNDEGQGQNEINWKARVEELENQNNRLLGESKKYKTRFDEVEELRNQLKSYQAKEVEQLEQAGNITELYERKNKDYEDLNSRYAELQQKTLRSNIFNAISNVARDAYDVNDLINQPEFASLIEVEDGSLNPSQESVTNFVNTLKEKKSYLFEAKKIATMADANPTPREPVAKPLSKMTREELAQIRQAKLKTM